MGCKATQNAMRMKKILFVLVTLLTCTLCAIADDYSCRVYGVDNVASVVRTSSTAYSNGGGPHLDVYVALTKPAQAETTIVVNVKDGSTVVGTAHVTISQGNKTPLNGYYIYYNSNMKDGKTYTLTIAKASCQ